jgi:hypothetical protein
VFFEPPREDIEDAEEERFVPPPWFGRPPGTVLAGVPLELVLARTPTVGVALSRLGACPDGFEAELTVLSTAGAEELDHGLWGPPAMRRRRGAAAAAEEMRFGVRYADGSKGELDGPWGDPEARPEGPVIRRQGGSGGEGEWRQTLWFWPLPPAGPLTFALEWRSQGIALGLSEVDAGPIRDAAERAQQLFPSDAMADTPGFTSGTMHAFKRDAESQ